MLNEKRGMILASFYEEFAETIPLADDIEKLIDRILAAGDTGEGETFDDKLLSEVDGRVAVSRELLKKSGLSKEIIEDLDGLFILIQTLKNQIISERSLPQSGTGEGENIIAFEALIHECLKTDLYREDFVFQRLTNDAIDRLRSMKDFPRSQEGEG